MGLYNMTFAVASIVTPYFGMRAYEAYGALPMWGALGACGLIAGGFCYVLARRVDG